MRNYKLAKISQLLIPSAAVVAIGIGAVGCQEAGEYETRKPVMEDEAGEGAIDDTAPATDMQSDPAYQPADEATQPDATQPDPTQPQEGAAAPAEQEAVDPAADANTTSQLEKPVVDIDTPLGDVNVDRDADAAGASVSVETPRVDVNVGENN
ncbi:hypothetical protein [Botrimarina sp.]|uniref:hypothetical protein n=1 Tax=Botrimarina sp. TaxID=2795802 RepID=UPI0032EF7C98